MNFLKRWAWCIISLVAGVCGLALSACSGMVSKVVFPEALSAYGLETATETTKAFKVLTDSNLYTQAKEAGLGKEFMTMKVFAIFTLIVSILLIAYAVVMLLKNLNVIKFESKIFDIVCISLFALLLISTIGLLIASNNYASEMEKIMKSNIALGIKQLETMLGSAIDWKLNTAVGVYQPTMLVISIISALVVGTFTFLNKKSA
jgi:hypothetical protein